MGGDLKGTYTDNGLEQLAIRVMTNQTMDARQPPVTLAA